VTEGQDTWTEMVDIANNLSLCDILKGKRINQYMGSYSTGASFVRVRNRQTNKVKMLEPTTIVTEEQTRYVDGFTVQEDDILECFWVTPTT
jgi:hypothetical protein